MAEKFAYGSQSSSVYNDDKMQNYTNFSDLNGDFSVLCRKNFPKIKSNFLAAAGKVRINDRYDEFTLFVDKMCLLPERKFLFAEGNIFLQDNVNNNFISADKLFFFAGKSESRFWGQDIAANIGGEKIKLRAKKSYFFRRKEILDLKPKIFDRLEEVTANVGDEDNNFAEYVANLFSGEEDHNQEKKYEKNFYAFKDLWVTPCGENSRCFGHHIWEFNSDEGELTDGKLNIKNAQLKVCGMPIIKLPKIEYSLDKSYLPDGFFFPKIYSISHEGLVLRVPYHYNISKEIDFIFAPHISMERMLPIIYELQLKHRTLSGGYRFDINASYIKGDIENEQDLIKDSSRYLRNQWNSLGKNESGDINALLKTRGNFSYLDGVAEIGFDINKLVGSRKITYAKKYLDNYDDTMISTIYSHYSFPQDRGYINLAVVEIDDLRPNSPYNSVINLPHLSFVYDLFQKQMHGWDCSYQIEGGIDNLRDEGQFWSKSKKDNYNFALNRYGEFSFGGSDLSSSSADLKLRGSFNRIFCEDYEFGLHPGLSIQSLSNIDQKISHSNGVMVVPNLDITLKKSWRGFSSSAGEIHIITPAVRFNFMPHNKTMVGIFDRQFLEYQSGWLFSENLRHRINDQTQAGSNIDYGFDWRYYGRYDLNVSVGGNRRLYGVSPSIPTPGESIYYRGAKNSAYNIQISGHVGENDFAARTWLRPDLLLPVHTEADFSFKRGDMILSLDYTFFNNRYYYADWTNQLDAERREFQKKFKADNEHEIGGELWRKIGADIWFNFSFRGKLNERGIYGDQHVDITDVGGKKKKLLSAGIGWRYQVDCLRIDFGVNKSNVYFKDLKPSVNYYVSFGVPILGF